MTRAIFLTLAICLAFVAPARVAYADEPSTRAAKRYYDRGQKLFALQKFEEALEQYQKAYDAKPIPEFLFNIGQCHRNLGDYDAAIFSFKRYLKLDPEASNREQVEELILQLEEKKAREDARKMGLREERDRSPPPSSEGRPVYKKWWFWTGVVALGAAGGVGYYVATSGGGPPDTSLGRNIVFGK